MTDQVNRRAFIGKTVAGSIAAGTMLSTATRALGANDRLVVALIGCGRQGRYDMEDMIRHGARVAAVCDVYQPNLQQALQRAPGADAVQDFRRILDRKDVDAVIIGAPDHWHALMTVMACQAGKDVYVEKPICVHVEEGQRMVEAARRYNRVVQVGTQQRSGPHFQKAVQLVWDGQIGNVEFVRTWNYGNEYPEGIGNPPDSEPPADLNWDLWLGPAPRRPFNSNRFGVGDRWSTFRYFWDYAGGMMTDWGVHLLDIVQWGLKADGPEVISAVGGKFLLQDNRETPDTLVATFQYPGCVVTYENRTCNANSMYGKDYGIEFHGTQGTLFVDRSGFTLCPEQKPVGAKGYALTERAEMSDFPDQHAFHVQNFMDCIKSRNRPISDIEIGHRSTSTCLLANVSYRTGQRLVWDVRRQQLREGGSEAQKLLAYDYRSPWQLSV
jgi:predicted dehydrogenase